jgi:hypothetical protein
MLPSMSITAAGVIYDASWLCREAAKKAMCSDVP